MSTRTLEKPYVSARDMSAGGLFLSAIAALAFMISSALPNWWFTTTELEGEMCSCGTGLWHQNVTWGDDLSQKDLYARLECSSSTPEVTERCDAPWEKAHDARRAGHISGALSILAIFSSMIAVYFGWKHVPGYGDAVNARRAFFFSLGATLLEFFTIAVFTDSPVFDDLSYYFGCHFVFNHPTNSNFLVCHALGPGWATAAIGMILSAVATIMYYFAYHPTHYLHPDTGRYSLFTEKFERRQEKLKALIMAEGESATSILLDYDEASSGPVGRFARAFGVPMLCVMNMTLFVYSNLSTGATVEPHISVTFPKWLAEIVNQIVDLKGGQTLEFRDDVFNFTLVSSLRHFWEAKAYALFVLIGAFSGVWPYAKIFAMLMLWFVPATERLRGRALHWIDILGKWSLIDSFFLCLMCVGFGFDTSVTILGIDIHVDIGVRPGWGVYSFVIATIWSLAMSHYLTLIHRSALERRTWTSAFLVSMKDPPHESLDSRPYAPYARHRRFKCVPLGRVAVWFLLVCTFCVTLAGQLTKTFRFKFGGLASLILTEEKAVNDYSLVTIAQAIPHAARNGGYLSGEGWNYFLVSQFLLLAMIVPLFRIVLLMVLWASPMTLKSAKRLHHLGEIVSAWSAMEVFLVSIVAAVMEIGALSGEVIGSAFGPLEGTLCEVLTKIPPGVLNPILHLVGLPSLDFSRGCQLFRVDAQLSEGCWILLAAILLCEFTSHLIMELAEASVAERMALLSAYHRVKHPLISPRRPARSMARGASRDLEPLLAGIAMPSSDRDLMGASSLLANNGNAGANSTTAHAAAAETPGPSRRLKKLLNAQETGARNFVGSWADFFYGPFPRKWWDAFARAGFMRRVEWEEIGRDLHEHLVVVGDDEDNGVIVVGGGDQQQQHQTRSSSSSSSSAYRPIPGIQQQQQQQQRITASGELQTVAEGEEEEASASSGAGSLSSQAWIAESPFTSAAAAGGSSNRKGNSSASSASTAAMDGGGF